MKKNVIGLMLLILPIALWAQSKKFEYTPKVKNKVEIKNVLGKVSLKNTTGAAIVVETNYDREIPERAKGLKLLGNMEDNTEIGLNISEENGVVSITGVSRQVREYDYTISIPVGISVDFEYNSPFVNGGDIEIESFKGNLEIKTLASNVKLINISGPLTVSSVSGNIEVILSSISQEGPTSLATVNGLIDLSVPSTEKATFEVKSVMGDVYNNLDLVGKSKVQEDKRSGGLDAIKHNDGSNFMLNGGGQKVILSTVSGNIYLRKK
jgi:hypothetical protein